MEQVKRFAFLVSNGADVMMVPGFGTNVEEAKQYASSNLHRCWYVVVDQNIIESFISENKDVDLSNITSEFLLREINQFKSNLKSLESQLINNKEELK